MDQLAWNRQQWRSFADIIMDLRISQKMTGNQLRDY